MNSSAYPSDSHQLHERSPSPETSNFITKETGTASDYLHRRPIISTSGPKGVDANVQ